MQLTVSIVSHGHSKLIIPLVGQLAMHSSAQINKVVLTSNTPLIDNFESICGLNGLPFKVELIVNEESKGFGANHNQAFKRCTSDFFCVLNPDVFITSDPCLQLVDRLCDGTVGCAYPLQVSANRLALDSERQLASPLAVLKRHVPFVGSCLRRSAARALEQGRQPVHWVNGAFMVFRSDVYREIGGFDERYFMYCEDVDICLRLQLAGYKLARANATVIHDTRRRTLRDPRHFAWHGRSLMRLWGSDAYRNFKSRFLSSSDKLGA